MATDLFSLFSSLQYKLDSDHHPLKVSYFFCSFTNTGLLNSSTVSIYAKRPISDILLCLMKKKKGLWPSSEKAEDSITQNGLAVCWLTINSLLKRSSISPNLVHSILNLEQTYFDTDKVI